MMIREVSKKTWILWGLFLVLLLLSVVDLDYSGLSTFSLSMTKDVLKGLSQPDWSFFYDGSGEDLVSLLILTIGIACLGTMIATVLAIPITLISAANLWHSMPWVAKVGKFVCNVLRAFPELVYAIIFVKVVGPGPFAGVMAIGVHQIGMLGKLFTEEMENMDERLTEEMQAVGANFWQTMFFVRVPYLMPIYSSFALNHFEIAVRSAATLGLVGAGGIGAPLIFAIQTRTWSKVSIILIGVVVTVFALDQITGMIRKKLR
jgi:phosphonate transport system permease protein